MTKVEDTWGGAAIEKQIAAATRERMPQPEIHDDMPLGDGATLADKVAAAIAAVDARLNKCKNFLEMFPIVDEVEATNVSTKAEMHVKAAVIQHIRKRIFASQQGVAAPAANINQAVHAEQRQRLTGEGKRRLEAGRLNVVLMVLTEMKDDVFEPIYNSSLGRLPEDARNISRTPREVLLAHAETREQLNAILVTAAMAQIAKLDAFNVVNRRDRIGELKTALEGETSHDVITKIQAELAALRAPEAEDISARRNREVTEKRQFAEKTAQNFQKWAIASLEAMHAEAVEFEQQMFGDLHLPHEETVISRRFKQAIAELRGLSTPEQFLRWFGMPSLTHVAEQLERAIQ